MKIKIGKYQQVGCRITCPLQIGNQDEELIINVNEFTLQYLTLDRIDAIVLGLLPFAMKNSCDFVSDNPISSELYYVLKFHYIPTICGIHSELHSVKILAPVIDRPDKVDGIPKMVATGISCGVDSLYTIWNNAHADIPKSMKFNTLCFFNVGAAMKSSKELRTELVKGRLDLAKSFATEYNYNFVFIESNIHLLIHKHGGYSHIAYHTFMALFCIYLIQKAIHLYEYSSGYPAKDFSLMDINYSARYDLFTLAQMSINGMHLYSGGAEKSRLEKMSALVNWEPAQKYLNVCVNSVKNDNKCFKCVRTMLEIDAVGDIDKFNRVFDVAFYRQNYKAYLRRLFIDAVLKRDIYAKECYAILGKKISLLGKILILIDVIINKIIHRKVIV